jgi:pyruvate formate lyase activating enzyme
LKHETQVWFELTSLLIPGENDSEAELEAMTQWVVENLGPDVPMHFTAFYPDWKMLDKPATPAKTLMTARRIALKNGVRYAYVGNIHAQAEDSTYCHQCGQLLIARDWYVLSKWALDEQGCCGFCGTPCAGVFAGQPGNWGAKRELLRF